MFKIFKKKREVFVTIEFEEWPGLVDYPKDLPVPRIGEIVRLNQDCGRVRQVKHLTEGLVTEIKISCEQL